jgi:hypothetical protein
LGLLEYQTLPSLCDVAHDGWLCTFTENSGWKFHHLTAGQLLSGQPVRYGKARRYVPSIKNKSLRPHWLQACFRPVRSLHVPLGKHITRVGSFASHWLQKQTSLSVISVRNIDTTERRNISWLNSGFPSLFFLISVAVLHEYCTKPEFVNVYGAQDSIPRNRFCQHMWTGTITLFDAPG